MEGRHVGLPFGIVAHPRHVVSRICTMERHGKREKLCAFVSSPRTRRTIWSRQPSYRSLNLPTYPERSCRPTRRCLHIGPRLAIVDRGEGRAICGFMLSFNYLSFINKLLMYPCYRYYLISYLHSTKKQRASLCFESLKTIAPHQWRAKYIPSVSL